MRVIYPLAGQRLDSTLAATGTQSLILPCPYPFRPGIEDLREKREEVNRTILRIEEEKARLTKVSNAMEPIAHFTPWSSKINLVFFGWDLIVVTVLPLRAVLYDEYRVRQCASIWYSLR